MEGWYSYQPRALNTAAGMADARLIGDQVKEAGYKTILTRIGNPQYPSSANNSSNAAYTTAAKSLLDYYRSIGLNTIPEVKVLGKSRHTYGLAFRNANNGENDLFVGDTIDPYFIYQGQPALQSLIIAKIDEAIAYASNPDYILLGWDESNTNEIQTIAQRNNVTVGDVWAGTLNAVTDHLIALGITPIIWGDQLLSYDLANANNVLNYPPDARFSNHSAVHSNYPPTSGVHVFEFVPMIANKDEIMVADWHYEREQEYPGVDYFQWLGFKEVLGATWGDPQNMKLFSTYAKSKGVKKMISNTFHFTASTAVTHLAPTTINNSIEYFHNPEIAVPEKPTLIIKKDGVQTFHAAPGDNLSFELENAGNNLQGAVSYEIYQSGNMLRNNPQNLPNGTWQVPSNASGLYTIQGYAKRADGHLLHAMSEGNLLITNTAVPQRPTANTNLLYGFDFTSNASQRLTSDHILLNGTGETRYGYLSGAVNYNTNAGYLDCAGGGMLIGRSFQDAARLEQDYRMTMQFRIDTLPSSWVSLINWGSFGRGVRILLNPNGTVTAQVAGLGQKVFRVNSNPVSTGTIINLEFKVENGDAILTVNNATSSISVPALNPPSVLLHTLALPLSVCSYYAAGIDKPFDGRVYSFGVYDSSQ